MNATDSTFAQDLERVEDFFRQVSAGSLDVRTAMRTLREEIDPMLHELSRELETYERELEARRTPAEEPPF